MKFTLHTYDYDPDAESIGLQAAEALGVEAARVLKTLMAEVDGKPVCAVVPSDCEVSMKKLAGAFGGKAANMMRPADAERLTGYHVGGISPFGQKKRVPVAIEETALVHAERVPQRRPARPAGRARSQRRREGRGRDRAAADGVSRASCHPGCFPESALFGEFGLRLRPPHRLDDRFAQFRAQPVIALDECQNGIGAHSKLLPRLGFGFFGRQWLVQGMTHRLYDSTSRAGEAFGSAIGCGRGPNDRTDA